MKKQAKKSSTGNETSKTKSENLPGYPYYAASDDIMNSDARHLSLDIENPEHPISEDKIIIEEINDPDLDTPTAADVTKEDLEMLGDENLAMDMGDDEDLKQRIFPVDMEGKDLDVPGAELDDEQEAKGSEDEENNLYSPADN